MRILAAADLHAPRDDSPYRQLGRLAREHGCGLVALAGDLLNLLAPVPHLVADRRRAVAWLSVLANQVPHVAVCTGNHDAIGPALLAGAAANVVADGQHQFLEDSAGGPPILVTCAPYVSTAAAAQKLWETAARRAREWQACWVVLHHVPPADSRVAAHGAALLGGDPGAGGADDRCADLVRTYRPDFLFCGHIHQAPFVAGGSWADLVGETWCLNPGRDGEGSRLVLLDTVTRIARWLTPDGKEVDRRRLEAPTAAAPGSGLAERVP